jgi:hypothetical protein
MIQDDVIEMAKQARLMSEYDEASPWVEDHEITQYVEAFAKLVAAKVIAELESQEPVAHCEAGPEFCQQCYKESLPTYGSEEVSKLREVIQSQAKIIADYEKQIDEPAIYPEEAYEMGLEAIAYYTHPPQRTWVGLTDEEITSVANNSHPLNGVRSFARAIEAKLKQKNGFAEEKNT